VTDVLKMGLKGIRKSLTRDSRGSSAVELVFAIPMLLLLVFGMIQFGFIFFVWNDMENAAREGARRLAVDDSITETAAKDVVEAWLVNWPATFTVTACTITADSASQSTCTGDDEVSVTVSAPMSEVALIGNLFDLFGTNALSVRVVMRKEGS
jgi:Flp pilus assembly protein TadG